MNWRLALFGLERILVAGMIFFMVWSYTEFVGEVKERRHQTCMILEGDQAEEIRRLGKTYDYLRDLSTEERMETINQAVYAGLPAQEEEARKDDAPPYCDEPNVGLREPDPRAPPRPEALK